MTLNEYQQAAQRTSTTRQSMFQIINGIMGLFGEGGELADVYKKYAFQGHGFDRDHMARELGDVLWYVAETASGLGMMLEEIAQMNIDKLKVRYPDGFEADRSLHRAEGDI